MSNILNPPTAVDYVCFIVIDYHDNTKSICPCQDMKTAKRFTHELLKSYEKAKLIQETKNTVVYQVVNDPRTSKITIQKSSFGLFKTLNIQKKYAVV